MWSAMVLLVALASVSCAAGDGVVLSVKVVKTEAGRCSAPPTLELRYPTAEIVLHLLDESDAWTALSGDAFRGENDWEVYWNLRCEVAEPPLARVEARCPGAKASRVLVGRTDVEFAEKGEAVVFRLVDDRHRGQLIQTVLDDPEGGLPIDLHHNWEMRRAGRYAEGPWPATRIAAHNNYLFAAREALKLMGGFGRRPQDNPFDGRIVLEGFETAFTRGHADYPPHFHIMLYPPGYQGAQVPHFYMDDEGGVESNAFGIVGVAGSNRAFGRGEWCSLKDLHGTTGLELTITDEGGLLLRRDPGQPEWLLIGDEAEGAAKAVCVRRGDALLCRCVVTDDAVRGEMAIQIERFRDGRPAQRTVEHVTYDPFTGRIKQRGRRAGH